MFNPFFDPGERRLRSLWRILLHYLVYMAFSGLFAYAVMAGFSVSMGIPFEPTRPGWVQSAAAQIPLHSSGRALAVASRLLAALAALVVAGRWFDRRRFADYGFRFNRGWWLDFGFGLALGAVLMALVFLVELAAGWVEVRGFMWLSPGARESSFALVTLVALFNYITVGINEEIFSRGYHLRNLAEGLRLWRFSPKLALLVGYLLSSTIFGLLHMDNPNTTWVSTLNLVIAGLFLGLGYVLTGDLAIPIGLHITWNFFQGRVFGFPVSGGATSSSFIAIRQGGQAWITGGAFGPEGGIIGLAAILFGCVLVLLWVKWRRGRVRLQDGIAAYQPPEPKAVTGAKQEPARV